MSVIVSGKIYEKLCIWNIIWNICPLQEEQASKRMSQQMSKSSSWLWILSSDQDGEKNII